MLQKATFCRTLRTMTEMGRPGRSSVSSPPNIHQNTSLSCARDANSFHGLLPQRNLEHCTVNVHESSRSSDSVSNRGSAAKRTHRYTCEFLELWWRHTVGRQKSGRSSPYGFTNSNFRSMRAVRDCAANTQSGSQKGVRIRELHMHSEMSIHCSDCSAKFMLKSFVCITCMYKTDTPSCVELGFSTIG